MSTLRFEVSRARLGSPIIRDNDGPRAVLVLLRDTGMPADAADVAAMRMAQFLARALNRSHEEVQQSRRQREGGR